MISQWHVGRVRQIVSWTGKPTQSGSFSSRRDASRHRFFAPSHRFLFPLTVNDSLSLPLSLTELCRAGIEKIINNHFNYEEIFIFFFFWKKVEENKHCLLG